MLGDENSKEQKGILNRDTCERERKAMSVLNFWPDGIIHQTYQFC
jgi:hypothetical protein